ncbi:hypothetical protein MJO28_005913 [Puccinia striiformis f. sp. tritici]|uniref:C2H2-type domain-containing protein n=4 Tax=Puccinia striiformis TaxID=27350 RepID=A0A0L0UXP8_9BASI|nr:hypothetical protein Pst134EB_012104 [Puccinia striiformis f. sp. tritici]KAI9626598.1 hypothetical protein H4Q26_017807 [Puccinia striiformis f. sp. tritici PST-130]KNE91499.1 hypothetical protein PSTG_15095 [Puccinia striiformis f. sp. tritici PST-78]POW07783.1 hypothetical protein PSTT_08000 [Puccinia striiformis]KAI7953366.1 hypothetical protein MJO28_005913 [Puccinia striiformis f. sp. tritici]
MGRLRRSRTHSSAKSQIKSRKTKRYTRDLDQIAIDMELAQAIRSVKTSKTDLQSSFVVPQAFGSTSHPTVTGEVDEDTTGCGKFPCVECARFFVDSRSLTEHQRGKVHKRRVKELAAGPYSLEEAMRAAGIGTDNRQRTAPNVMVS